LNSIPPFGFRRDLHRWRQLVTPGWRASLAFFYAWLMDWERIAVYDGGWCEWSRDGGNPVRSLVVDQAEVV
jgi:hypothetical protein